MRDPLNGYARRIKKQRFLAAGGGAALLTVENFFARGSSDICCVVAGDFAEQRLRSDVQNLFADTGAFRGR